MKKEKFNNYDVFHSFLVENADYEGYFELPVIKTSNLMPEKLMPFSKAMTANKKCGFLIRIFLKACRLDSVFHKHRDGHRADAAGNGSDRAGNARGGFKVHISAELAFLVSVHTDVDNDRAFFYHIACDEFCLADRGNQNVRPACDLREIFRFGVADGDRSVSVEKEHCLRLSDYVASADDDALLALGADAGLLYKLHHAGRSAGKEVKIPDHDLADVCRGECVHIFFFADGVDDLLLVNVRGERKLNEYSVDLVRAVKMIDELQKLRLGHGLGKGVFLRIYVARLAGLFLVVDIHARRRVISGEYYRETRPYALLSEGERLFCHFLLYPCRNFFSVQYLH